MAADNQINEEIKDFSACLVPFGSTDVRTAIKTALEAEHDGQWDAELIEEYIDSTGEQLKDVDPVYVVYEALLQEARNDIKELIGKDILNDTEEQIEVYGNYTCTNLDYTETAQKELKRIMKRIRKADFTPAMKWLWKNANL